MIQLKPHLQFHQSRLLAVSNPTHAGRGGPGRADWEYCGERGGPRGPEREGRAGRDKQAGPMQPSVPCSQRCLTGCGTKGVVLAREPPPPPPPPLPRPGTSTDVSTSAAGGGYRLPSPLPSPPSPGSRRFAVAAARGARGPPRVSQVWLCWGWMRRRMCNAVQCGVIR
jgi:hypothetical protein